MSRAGEIVRRARCFMPAARAEFAGVSARCGVAETLCRALFDGARIEPPRLRSLFLESPRFLLRFSAFAVLRSIALSGLRLSCAARACGVFWRAERVDSSEPANPVLDCEAFAFAGGETVDADFVAVAFCAVALVAGAFNDEAESSAMRALSFCVLTFCALLFCSLLF